MGQKRQTSKKEEENAFAQMLLHKQPTYCNVRVEYKSPLRPIPSLPLSLSPLPSPSLCPSLLISPLSPPRVPRCTRPPLVHPRVRVPLFLLRRLEDLERAHEGLVYGHHGACVVKLTAVVGGGEEGYELPAGEKLVPVLDDLVGTADEV